MSPRKKGAHTPMSDAHKAALAEGRAQGRAVRAYLEALESHRPKRGRKRTKDSIEKRLLAIDQALPTADPLTRVTLIQERMKLKDELTSMTAPKVDLASLENEFVKALAPYSQRRGITYAAWREAGVDASLLKKAGVSRSS